ncbi:MAG: Branched-chain amino acid transport ATP-binding protein LivF, partial [uncultured Acetobacteraceae bacterium]
AVRVRPFRPLRPRRGSGRGVAGRRGGRGAGAAGPQRRRQEHHHEGDHGAGPSERRPGRAGRSGHHRGASVRGGATRPGLRAGGPARLRRAHGRGEPGGRPEAAAAGRGGLDARARLRAVPLARGHARPAGRADERRGAADARHRPHADGQPAVAVAGRAERRLGAGGDGTHGGGPAGAQGRRPVHPAVRAESPIRPRGGRLGRGHRGRPHPLARRFDLAFRGRGNAVALPLGV